MVSRSRPAELTHQTVLLEADNIAAATSANPPLCQEADIWKADICKSKAPGFGVQAETLTSGLVSPLLIARLDMNKVWN